VSLLTTDVLLISFDVLLRNGVILPLPEIGGLRPNHVGEVLFFAAVGCVLATALLAAIRCGNHNDWALSRRLMTLFAILAVFGVALDAIHSLFRYTWLNDVLAVIEDGGEMLVLTFLLATVSRDAFLSTSEI
jgi:hypothetical protein